MLRPESSVLEGELHVYFVMYTWRCIHVDLTKKIKHTWRSLSRGIFPAWVYLKFSPKVFECFLKYDRHYSRIYLWFSSTSFAIFIGFTHTMKYNVMVHKNNRWLCFGVLPNTVGQYIPHSSSSSWAASTSVRNLKILNEDRLCIETTIWITLHELENFEREKTEIYFSNSVGLLRMPKEPVTLILSFSIDVNSAEHVIVDTIANFGGLGGHLSLDFVAITNSALQCHCCFRKCLLTNTNEKCIVSLTLANSDNTFVATYRTSRIFIKKIAFIWLVLSLLLRWYIWRWNDVTAKTL